MRGHSPLSVRVAQSERTHENTPQPVRINYMQVLTDALRKLFCFRGLIIVNNVSQLHATLSY